MAGVRELPTAKVICLKHMFEHVPPRFLRRIVTCALWEGPPESGTVALTFDDGPDPDITPYMLDTLEERGCRATFFLVGKHVASHPGLARAIVRAGHTVGNHSMSHRRMLFMDKKDIEREIDGASREIFDATGIQPKIFRPPYGVFSFATARKVRDRGMRMVLWTVLSGDYRDDPSDVLLARVKPFVRPGAIMVFHDTVGGGGMMLPDLIEKIISIACDNNLRFGTIDDLVNTREFVTMGGA